MGNNHGEAHVSSPGNERVAMTPFGARMFIQALASETNGAFGVWDTFTAPGEGPAPHIHTRETEMFRVVVSIYRFWCGGEVFDAPPGTIVILPPLVEHAWRNIGGEMGQMLGIVTPGGCEGMFRDIAALGQGASLEEIARVEARYGIINAQTAALALSARLT